MGPSCPRHNYTPEQHRFTSALKSSHKKIIVLTFKCSVIASFCSVVISPTLIRLGRWSNEALSLVHTRVVLGSGLLLTGVPLPRPLTTPLPHPFVGGSIKPRDFA